jgi:hypothetical protein
MVNAKKNNFTNLKKALKNIGGKGSMKNKLISFLGGSLSNYLTNLCCIYEGVKNALNNDKVVITGSAAVLLHAINSETEDKYKDLSTLKKLVSIPELEDNGNFSITSDFDFLIVQKDPNIYVHTVEIREFTYKRSQKEPGHSLNFRSEDSTCPPFDITVVPSVIYNEIKYNNKVFDVLNLSSLYNNYK